MNNVSRKTLNMMGMRPTKVSRPVVALIITIIVVLSPIMIFVNPLSVSAAPVSYEKIIHDRMDTSSSNARAGSSMSPAAADDTSTDSSLSTSPSPSMTTGTTTIQGPLTSPSTKQTNNIVNTQSEFAVTFKTSTTDIIKKILVTFPAGTNLGSVNLLITREGIGPGTAEKTSSTTITYTVTSAVSVPAGTLIKLEFGTIVNSPNPGNQFVTVSTRDAANSIIDGPTAIGYSLKQIGTADIAPDAIVPFVNQRFGSEVTVNPSSTGNGVATCLLGEQVVGGGFTMPASNNPFLRVVASFRDSPATWIVFMYNEDSANSHTFFPIAECMPALP